ncbi:hypothetical protein CH371_11150 [Leptospira wolffii]|uniref:Uncharacterized protein n=1 Tax=Leptospira wolffii TaxID=409998 RepID=A0A2M9ZC96_9LEPT|nr:hypothetical protein [Leptospira wolffii]PJZ66063.1 hypothetical protein CH371_11150 [Leptospira wolffii]
MEPIDYIRNQNDVIFGHKSVSDKFNLKDELKQLKINPFSSLIDRIDPDAWGFIKSEGVRLVQSYEWYSFSLERVLTQISLARRYGKMLDNYKIGKPYTTYQRKLTADFRMMVKFNELDYQNLIIHAVLFLNRTLAISRLCWQDSLKPSFTSFNNHKVFLKKNREHMQKSALYADGFLNKTEWYEIPLKILRDKFLMHAAEPHSSMIAWGKSDWDLDYIVMIPAERKQEKIFEKVKLIQFSARRLQKDIDSYLAWLIDYANQRI